MTLFGYADRRIGRPGDTVTLMVSSDAAIVHAELFRLIDGTPDPKGAPAPARRLDPPVLAQAPGMVQRSVVGSRADLPLPAEWGSDEVVLVRCWVCPTTGGIAPGASDAVVEEGNVRMAGRLTSVEERRQVIWAFCEANGGARLSLVLLADGRIAVEADGTVVVATIKPVRTRTWYGILVGLQGGTLALDISTAVGEWHTTDHTEHVEAPILPSCLAGSDLFRLASASTEASSDSLNGKIAHPSISVGAIADDVSALLGRQRPLPGRIIGDWDPSIVSDAGKVFDTSPNGLHGQTFNLAMHCATGPFWSARGKGSDMLTPQHDALQFHSDAVGDLGWKPTLQLTLPEGLSSGVYAVRLSAGQEFMHIPLFVRAVAPHARVAFLAPTNTYLAYANHRMFLGNDELHHLIATHPVEPNDRDVLVLEHAFLGRSLYDTHDDGSGVHMASWNRPIISLEPAAKDFLAAGPRNFQADLYTIGWLERSGLAYDVITDEDLHAEGVEGLRPYDVVVTGSHPEYWSRPMMDGLQAYLMSKGKLMYLGGNGFYWMTGFTQDRSTVEVRRGYAGTRPWDSAPGEVILQTSGEAAGHWRDLGVSPQSVVGVGFTAQGWGGAYGYKRLPQSLDPRVAPFFEGIAAEEIIGEFGHIMGGAAGDELDRLDYALGTPPHALHLATSHPFPDQYQLAVEEVRNMTPTFGGSQSEMVRSDIVWFDLPGGGEVFSVGSVNWAASMGWNHGDNNVAMMTTNVLTAFLAGGANDRAAGKGRAG